MASVVWILGMGRSLYSVKCAELCVLNFVH